MCVLISGAQHTLTDTHLQVRTGLLSRTCQLQSRYGEGRPDCVSYFTLNDQLNMPDRSSTNAAVVIQANLTVHPEILAA